MKNYLIYLLVNILVVHIFYYIEKKEIFFVDFYREFIKDYSNRIIVVDFLVDVLSIFIGWFFVVLYYILKIKDKIKK